jgi:hypothetical protein
MRIFPVLLAVLVAAFGCALVLVVTIITVIVIDIPLIFCEAIAREWRSYWTHIKF